MYKMKEALFKTYQIRFLTEVLSYILAILIGELYVVLVCECVC